MCENSLPKMKRFALYEHNAYGIVHSNLIVHKSDITNKEKCWGTDDNVLAFRWQMIVGSSCDRIRVGVITVNVGCHAL